jgi:hypothetical protein
MLTCESKKAEDAQVGELLMSHFRRNLLLALLLAVVLAVSFFSAFLVISQLPFAYSKQKAYSTPAEGLWPPEGFFFVGPAPNSTGVPLDTTVVIDETRPSTVSNLTLTPEAVIERQTYKVYVASPEYTFYFAEPLRPATTYNVSVIIGGDPISWRFTTTPEPFHPRFVSVFLEANALLASTIIATVTTLGAGLVIWTRRLRSK